MWIERLDVDGFRRLDGSLFEFSRELTIVVGDNESGKSSLHEALIRALFGFSKSERRKRGGASLLDRSAPWGGGAFGLVATVQDDEGRARRIEWDFARHGVTLYDESGQDVSDRVRAKNEEVILGQVLLGMDLDDFRDVCCIDQVSVSAVRSSPSLGIALQEAVANIGGDTPVEHAIERMNDFLRAAIGARIDTLSPSPTGKLSTLGREKERVVEQLRAAEEARALVVQLAREYGTTREELGELTLEQEEIRQRLLLTERRELEHRLDEAKRLGEEAAEHPARNGIAPATVKTIEGTLSRLDDLAVETKEIVTEVGRVSAEVERLEEDQRRLTAAVDGLEAYADTDPSARDGVQASWAKLTTVLADEIADAPPIPDRDPELARYRGERAGLVALASAHSVSTGRRALWIGLVIVSLGIALLLRMLVRRLRGDQPPGGLAEHLARYGASSIEELDQRVSSEDFRVAQAEAVTEAFREKRARSAEEHRRLEGEIVVALDGATAPPAPALEARVSAYLTAARQHEERLRHVAQLERVRRELEEMRRPANEKRRLGAERERLDRVLKASYAELGIEADDLSAGGLAFDRLVEEDKAAQEAQDRAARAQSALAATLGDETIETLAERVEDARRLHVEHLAMFGELASEGGGAEQLKTEVAKRDRAIREKQAAATTLETRIAGLEDQAGDPAELKERLNELEARTQRLEEARDAVALARTVLQQAAGELKRQFAPHLNEALKRNLPRITGGRYADGMIDSGLQVSVVAPETGRLVSAELLSRATKDQIFLVQRLEIARLLAPTKGSTPLFLDDPFARYDANRLRRGLEVVREAAAERQVILFSEDAELIELAASLGGGCAVIELSPPTGALTVAEPP